MMSHITMCHTSQYVTHHKVSHITMCHTSQYIITHYNSHDDTCHKMSHQLRESTDVIYSRMSHVDQCCRHYLSNTARKSKKHNFTALHISHSQECNDTRIHCHFQQITWSKLIVCNAWTYTAQDMHEHTLCKIQYKSESFIKISWLLQASQSIRIDKSKVG